MSDGGETKGTLKKSRNKADVRDEEKKRQHEDEEKRHKKKHKNPLDVRNDRGCFEFSKATLLCFSVEPHCFVFQ